MSRVPVKLSTAVASGISLFILYIVFLAHYALVADWSNLSGIELWILITQVARLIGFLVVRSKYQMQPLVPIILFSIESLLIPPLLALFVYTGNPTFALSMGTILTAWMGVTSIILSPYLIFAFSKSIISDTSLLGVLSLSALEFAEFIYLALILEAASTPIIGLSGLGAYLVGSLRSQAVSVGVPFLAQDPLIAIASVLFFMALLIYSTRSDWADHSKINWNNALMIPFISTMIVLIWTVLAADFFPNIFLALTIPTVALSALVWNGAREEEPGAS